MKRADASAGFWRCGTCGTPNPWADYLKVCVGCGGARPTRPAAGTARDRPRPAPGPPAPRRTRLGRWTLMACWAYAAILAALVALMVTLGDSWWPTTVLLFGPRWLFALPLTILAPLAATVRRKALWPLLAASALLIGPLLDFRLPWRAYLQPSTIGLADAKVRVLTCNDQMGNADFVSLTDLIATTLPDIIVIQECTQAKRFTALFEGLRWHSRFEGSLMLASRFPIGKVERYLLRRPWGGGTIVRFELNAPFGPLHVFGVHLETPRDGLEALLGKKWRGIPDLQENIAQRWHESELASRWVGQFSGPVLIAGDFNMPVDSGIYRRCWSGYSNAFSEAGFGVGHTKFNRLYGIRIDHVLAGRGWSCRRGWVGPDLGSDHRPLIADMEWVGNP